MTSIMAIPVVEFSSGVTKLERFLHKNQHTQRKLLNFEIWIIGELSKIGHHSNKLILSKNVNNKYRKVAIVTCYYSENQVFGGATNRDMSLNETCFYS